MKRIEHWKFIKFEVYIETNCEISKKKKGMEATELWIGREGDETHPSIIMR